MNAIRHICFAAFILWLTACNRPASSSNSSTKSGDEVVVLARIGGETITLPEFEAELKRRAHGNPQKLATKEQRRKVLEGMVQFRVVLAAAKAAGYDRDPEIQAKVNQFIVSSFQESKLAGNIVPNTPDDVALRDFYQQRLPEFTTPAAVRAAVIYFKCSPKATAAKQAELKQKSESVLTHARGLGEADFRRLVQEYSEDVSTRYINGDTGWLTDDKANTRWDESVINAAFSISEPGQRAPLVRSPDGFYVVRLTDRRPAGVRPFDQVKDAIAYQVTHLKREQREREVFEEMKRGIKVETYPELLDSIPAAKQASELKPVPLPQS